MLRSGVSVEISINRTGVAKAAIDSSVMVSRSPIDATASAIGSVLATVCVFVFAGTRSIDRLAAIVVAGAMALDLVVFLADVLSPAGFVAVVFFAMVAAVVDFGWSAIRAAVSRFVVE